MTLIANSLAASSPPPRAVAKTPDLQQQGPIRPARPVPDDRRTVETPHRTRIGASRSLVDAAQARQAAQAMKKMAQVQRALSSPGSLESALATLLTEQSRLTDETCKTAKQAVMMKLGTIHAQNMKELKEIQDRIKAEREASFWSKVVAFFKGLAAAISAASSIFTGPAGIVGAALLVASIVVSYTAPESWGKWLSLGLGVAGALCGGVSTLLGEAAKGAARLASTTLKICAAASETMAAGGLLIKGVCDRTALEAQAALAEIKSICQRLLAEAAEEREEMKLALQTQEQGCKVIVAALTKSHEVSLRALGRREP